MDQSQVRWALFKITLLTLFVSSWVFASFVLESRPDDILIASDSKNSVAPQPEDALQVLARLPASIPAQLPVAFSSARVMAPIKMDVVKMDCWDRLEVPTKKVEARWFRLTGRPCQSDSAPEAIEVRNMTNGYVGTVFGAETQVLTTDFIPLQEGDNEILIRFSHADGVAFENRFTLLRPESEAPTVSN